MGWIVPEAEYDPNITLQPISAGISMRNPDGGNPMDPQKPRIAVTTVDAEEREVRNVQAHAQKTRQLNTAPRGQRHASAADSQEGIPVRTLSSATVHRTNLDDAGAAIREAEKIKVQPGVGRTREDLANSLPEGEREAYLAEVEAFRSAREVEEDPRALRERAANQAILERRVVGRAPALKNQDKDGFNITNTVGNGIETFDLGGTGGAGADHVEVVEIDGIKITNTNGPRKKVAAKQTAPAPTRVVATVNPPATDSRRRIAKSICPDFPDNYNFDDAPRKKVARLQADYEDRPDVIRAVAAAETDLEVRNRLVEEFPEAFVG